VTLGFYQNSFVFGAHSFVALPEEAKPSFGFN
jgi:hypothetical protein